MRRELVDGIRALLGTGGETEPPGRGETGRRSEGERQNVGPGSGGSVPQAAEEAAPARFYVCPSCDTTYVSPAMSTCSVCGGAVEQA